MGSFAPLSMGRFYVASGFIPPLKQVGFLRQLPVTPANGRGENRTPKGFTPDGFIKRRQWDSNPRAFYRLWFSRPAH
jgi:hypothetical protein